MEVPLTLARCNPVYVEQISEESECEETNNIGTKQIVISPFIKSILPQHPNIKICNKEHAPESITISILGMRNVGKTSIVQSIADGEQKIDLSSFEDKYTVSFDWSFSMDDLSEKMIDQINNNQKILISLLENISKMPRHESYQLQLTTQFNIFDPNPLIQTEFHSILPNIEKSQCLLFVFSIYNEESLLYMTKLLQKCRPHIGDKVIIIAANKNDMKDKHNFYEINTNISCALNLSQRYNAQFIECAATTHNNIYEIFEYFCKEQMKKNIKTAKLFSNTTSEQIAELITKGLYPNHMFMNAKYDQLHDIFVIVISWLDMCTNIMAFIVLFYDTNINHYLCFIVLGMIALSYLILTIFFVAYIKAIQASKSCIVKCSKFMLYAFLCYLIAPSLSFFSYLKYNSGRNIFIELIDLIDYSPDWSQPTLYEWKVFKINTLSGFFIQGMTESVPMICVQCVILHTDEIQYDYLLSISILISVVSVASKLYFFVMSTNLYIFYFEWLCYVTNLLALTLLTSIIINFPNAYGFLIIIILSLIFILFSQQVTFNDTYNKIVKPEYHINRVVSVLLWLATCIVFIFWLIVHAVIFIFAGFGVVGRHSFLQMEDAFADIVGNSLPTYLLWQDVNKFISSYDRNNEKDKLLRIICVNQVFNRTQKLSSYRNEKLDKYLFEQQSNDYIQPFKDVTYYDLLKYSNDETIKALKNKYYFLKDSWKLSFFLISQILLFLCPILFYYTFGIRLYWFEYAMLIIFIVMVFLISYFSGYIFEYNKDIGCLTFHWAEKCLHWRLFFRLETRKLFMNYLQKYYDDCFLYHHIHASIGYCEIAKIITQYVPDRFVIKKFISKEDIDELLDKLLKKNKQMSAD